MKILYPEDTYDPSQLIIDVLRPSRLTHPARLSAETIVNIAENTIVTATDKHTEILRLLQDGLERTLMPFLRWTETRGLPNGNDEAMLLLWLAVSRTGNVMAKRMAREYTELARARGLISRWEPELEDDDEEDLPSDEPIDDVIESDLLNLNSVQETTMRLLDAGFKPQHPFVNSRLKTIVKKVMANYVGKFRIEVPGSVVVFCVPGTLY
jgi:hypothetical protein